MICMALSVWLVHSLGESGDCKSSGNGRTLAEITLESAPEMDNSGSSNEYTAATAGIFVGIFIVFIVAFTFLLVWLYKTGRTKFIMAWLMVSVFLIFAYVGGVYIFEFCRSRCIDLDWITLCLAVWNFTITGLFAVFGVVPRIVNQAYLIVMSALMAYLFRTLPEWATWSILGALVVWDLFAVLAPCGPLRLLVNAARERGDPLPALVYDTNPEDVGRDIAAQPSVVFNKKPPAKAQDATDVTKIDAELNSSPEAVETTQPRQRDHKLRKKHRNTTTDTPPQSSTTHKNSRTTRDATTNNGEADGEIRVGTLGSHLKLGLGDFVFYSILVAQASRAGAMTAITSFVAILAGLCATLFLVTVYKKALPALPISISVGLLFYVLTRYTVQPFVANLLPELLFH